MAVSTGTKAATTSTTCVSRALSLVRVWPINVANAANTVRQLWFYI